MFFKVIQCLEKSNNCINTKHSKINRLQKYIKYIELKQMNRAQNILIIYENKKLADV